MFKNPLFALGFVTLFLVIYTVLGHWDTNHSLVTVMFIFSPFLMIWLVYTVLRYGEPSERTFDEYFYDDVDIKS
ncbi:hypothetical protein GCM10027275_31900 [Rhabdobacter roseus]|uniref:Uncharacterized protein n=1 Tax=Rhabdobacter roseus TaxID=1655419 RepID=A0A840TZT5_9BACT|nr:hypothetical protein [Rhabdobacter roseus]MBB5285149.1 hypothetical protein [Rhabdobacter roseus]